MQHNSVEVVVTIPVVVAVVILGMAVVLVVVEVATAAAHNKIMFVFLKWPTRTAYVNPFTAPACKISGLKSAHMHACKQYNYLTVL